MTKIANLETLDRSALFAWLRKALSGSEPLPRLTPDEAPHLAIARLDRELTPGARGLLREGCWQLLREFCATGKGEEQYLLELMSLFSCGSFHDAETVSLLAGFALRLGDCSSLGVSVQIAILSALVETRPPRPPEFWKAILQQDRTHNGLLALSGLLSTYPEQALSILPDLQDSERTANAVALKVDLAWDEMSSRRRFKFVEQVYSALPFCPTRIGTALHEWARSKQDAEPGGVSPTLKHALAKALGENASPKALTPKLCSTTKTAA